MLRSIVYAIIASMVLVSTSMAKEYKCPKRITIDHQKGLVANLKTGKYSHRSIAVRGDYRLFKSGDWDRSATFKLGKHGGRCQSGTRVINGEGFNSIICECIDEKNNITFTAAKSVLGGKCEANGKLKFSCN
jgi:hypothetical protein